MSSISLDISKKGMERLRKMPDLMVPAVFKGMRKAMLLAEAASKRDYLSGQALRVRTGRLRGSITSAVDIKGDTVLGRIGTNVIYARIHELGGIIMPKTAKALRFQVAPGEWRTAQKVVMPARPFLRPAIMDRLEDMSRAVGKELETAFKR